MPAKYSLDIYTHPTEKLMIAIRRLEPYTDAAGVYHPGTGKGINVWFSKMNFARSGRASATISAQTSTSHALFFTQPQDWRQQVGYKTGISRDDINSERASVAKRYTKLGYTFVGNENHKLGEHIGVIKPGYSTSKRLTADLKLEERKCRISKMTEYVPENYKLTKTEVADLLDRCISLHTNTPIITISDLFKEICTIVVAKMP